MGSKKNKETRKKDYIPFHVYIDNDNFKKFINFGYKLINKKLDKGEKLFLNISSNNFVNAKLRIFFFTSSQLMKILKNNYKLTKISFSRTQISKTFLNVMKMNFSIDKLKMLNNSLMKQRSKNHLKKLKTENVKKAKQLKLQDQFETLKKENAKKAKQLKKLKPQNQLETLKKENAKKEKKKNLKNKINLDTFVKNSLKKYKEPKPKKKSIWDVIELPKPLVI